MKLKSSLSALLSLSAVILLALPTITMPAGTSSKITVKNNLTIPIELLWSTQVDLISYPADPKNPKIIQPGEVFTETRSGLFGTTHYDIKVTVPVKKPITITPEEIRTKPELWILRMHPLFLAGQPITTEKIEKTVVFEHNAKVQDPTISISPAGGPHEEGTIIDVPGFGRVRVSASFK